MSACPPDLNPEDNGLTPSCHRGGRAPRELRIRLSRLGSTSQKLCYRLELLAATSDGLQPYSCPRSVMLALDEAAVEFGACLARAEADLGHLARHFEEEFDSRFAGALVRLSWL